MRMRNDDLKKITEIKQHLLDPPPSFKLYDYALNYVQDALEVLKDYDEAGDTTAFLNNLLEQLQSKNIPQEDLRPALKEAGIKLGRLTNK